MNELPEWWNDLIDWFLSAKSKDLPLNMSHAWRVNRYADRVCNGGFADFLDTRRAEMPDILASLAIVGTLKHLQTLKDAQEFRYESRPKRRLPKIAQIPKAVAYDCLFRGWTEQKTIECIAEICPTCPSKLYPLILEVATGEVVALARWESLGAIFNNDEPELRQCIANFAQTNAHEWQH